VPARGGPWPSGKADDLISAFRSFAILVSNPSDGVARLGKTSRRVGRRASRGRSECNKERNIVASRIIPQRRQRYLARALRLLETKLRQEEIGASPRRKRRVRNRRNPADHPARA
jgi:hypothetical protein